MVGKMGEKRKERGGIVLYWCSRDMDEVPHSQLEDYCIGSSKIMAVTPQGTDS